MFIKEYSTSYMDFIETDEAQIGINMLSFFQRVEEIQKSIRSKSKSKRAKITILFSGQPAIILSLIIRKNSIEHTVATSSLYHNNMLVLHKINSVFKIAFGVDVVDALKAK